jgi:hypothetical protein
MSKVSLKLYPQTPSQLTEERTEPVTEADEFNTLVTLEIPEKEVAGFSRLYSTEETSRDDERSTLVAEARAIEKSDTWLAAWVSVRLELEGTALGLK